MHRTSLARWAEEEIDSKVKANDVFDRMCNAIRVGRFAGHQEHADLTFAAFGDLYLKRYVELRGLRSRGHIERRLAILKERWKGKRLTDIRVGEIEDLIQDLRTSGARGKRPAKPATINRYLALLRHMTNWAVAREYIDRTPFRRGSQALIGFERENNRRIRRVSPEEEARLLTAGNAVVRMMVVAAVDTGMRRGELLALRFGDIDRGQQLIHVRAEHAKSKTGRVVPIGTTRLRSLLEWLRIGPDGQPKASDLPVFTRGDAEAVKSFRTAWERARTAAGMSDVRFHDLRSEYASRLAHVCGPGS